MRDKCPVCGFAHRPEEFSICPSCGTEFGYDDASKSYEQLRIEWLGNGAVWFSDALQKPYNWNPMRQLLKAGFLYTVNTDSKEKAILIRMPEDEVEPYERTA